jgi:hypothetical protein
MLLVQLAAASSRARETFAQYMTRPPVSLKKMLVEEHAGSALHRSEYNPYSRTDSRLFPAREFLVEVLQHLPDPGARLTPWAAAGCAADSESPPLRAVFLVIARYMVPQAPSAPPAACSAPRPRPPGHPESVRLCQRITRGVGTAARKGLRS